MKKGIKKIASLVVLSIFLCSLCMQAVAVQVETIFRDNTRKGSISVDFISEQVDLENVTFAVYQITKFDRNGEQELLPAYDEVPVDFDDLSERENWLAFRDNLQNFINLNMQEPDSTFVTDADGSYTLKNLPAGIYYLQADSVKQGDTLAYAEPILILVGEYDADYKDYVYDHKVEPKVTVTRYRYEYGYEYEFQQDITVDKLWKETTSDLLIPDHIEVGLYCNGVLHEVVTLSPASKWAYTWEDLNPEYSWSVQELTVLNNFTPSYTREMYDFTIINTYNGDPEQQIPQTGTNSTLIASFASVGIVFLLISVLLKLDFRMRKRDEETTE